MNRILIGILAVACFCQFASAQVKVVPERADDNLIVAAYNIQWLGHKDHDLEKLAKVIAHFDLCGIIEVKNEQEIRRLADVLKSQTNEDWRFVFGVRTHRPGGTYHEAYGFIWRDDRVRIGNGVVGNIWDQRENFRNDPFVASFQTPNENFDFVMALIHTRWSDDEEGSREEEVRAAVQQILWFKGILTERDLIFAGDFNYSGKSKIMKQMATEANLVQLDNNPKSTFKTNGKGFASSYDHIYVGRTGRTKDQLVTGSCNTLDVCHLIYGDNTPANMKKARSELSDHLPVFAVFKTDTPDDD